MGLLDIASSRTISRGFDYYLNNHVKNIRQINDYEYEGHVKGTLDEPYFVHLNIKHSKKSYCDCLFANGNRICKHMIALYFTVFEDEANEYGEWINSNCNDEFDEYEEYYDNYSMKTDFKEPLFFNKVLDNYLDSLSTNQLKSTLKEVLLKDKENTYYCYLKNDYEKYLAQDNHDFYFLNSLHNNIETLLLFYNYDHHDFTQKILTRKERGQLLKLYNQFQYRSVIEQLILKHELAAYDDYRNLILTLKSQIKTETLKDFSESLNTYFETLKSYRMSHTIPKSNVLIILDIIKDYIGYHLPFYRQHIFLPTFSLRSKFDIPETRKTPSII